MGKKHKRRKKRKVASASGVPGELALVDEKKKERNT